MVEVSGKDHARIAVFGGKSLVCRFAAVKALEVEGCLFMLTALVEP